LAPGKAGIPAPKSWTRRSVLVKVPAFSAKLAAEVLDEGY